MRIAKAKATQIVDASFLSCNFKRQKLSEEQYMGMGNKSMNDLPDTVLRRIISSLPMKEAVRTSVLSKRWEYLWTSIPNLEFEENSSAANRELFVNFVERVLVLHDSSHIKRFSLDCDVLHHASHISTWIAAVVRRNAKEFFLNLRITRQSYVLPHCLFTCATVQVLDLALHKPYVLKFPCSIYLSSLKILSLTKIIFSDECSTQKLLSGCPLLEELSICNCNWANLKVVTISSPKLWSLTIYETGTQTWNDRNGCQVMICGTSLKYFRYAGELLNDYCLLNLPSLAEAYIDIYFDDKNERSRQIACRVYKLLNRLSNVEELTLSYLAVEVLSHAAELHAHMPIFNHLTTLVFYSDLVYFDSMALLKILQNSPHLSTLVINDGIELESEGEEILNPVPPCFISCLKNIKIRTFDWRKEELRAVKILLQNAVVLENMFIFCSQGFRNDLERQKQLLKLPRGSKDCELSLRSV